MVAQPRGELPSDRPDYATRAFVHDAKGERMAGRRLVAVLAVLAAAAAIGAGSAGATTSAGLKKTCDQFTRICTGHLVNPHK